MPKAAVDEDRFSKTGKHQVGGAGQVAAVKPEPEAKSMCDPSYNQLGSSVLATNPRH
jgi:hypothetical protein